MSLPDAARFAAAPALAGAGRDRLRVALVTAATLSPAAGGLAVSIPALARALQAETGAEVHVLGTRDPADPDAAAAWGARVQAHRVWGPRALQFAPGLGRGLARLAPDVVDSQGLWTWPSLAAHCHRGAASVVTPRGMLEPWALVQSARRKALALRLFERAHLERARCLRATAEMEEASLRALGLCSPVAIVPNGVEMPPPPRDFPPDPGPAPSRARRRALFLSRLHPKKGLPLLLPAWARIEAQHPDWELVVAGIDEDGHEAEMRALAARLGLGRVSWAGPVHGAAKSALYRSAELFVLPTHSENFGLVVAEALAHGVPVLTTRGAPWPELEARGAGWWVAPEAAALEAALARALGRPTPELAAMGARGRDWMAGAFSWAAVARQMAAVYLWTLGRGPRPACVSA